MTKKVKNLWVSPSIGILLLDRTEAGELNFLVVRHADWLLLALL